jgi:GDP-L-fucose synthase
MNIDTERTLVTGGYGMLGCAFQGILPNATYLSSKECDLTDYDQTRTIFNYIQPQYVIHLAARVGGLGANMDYPADFYRANIQINTNVLECAKQLKVEKLVAVLSTCIYPAEQYVKYPLTEDQLHLGPPHPSNFGYAYAKRMLDVQARAYRQQYGCNFISVVPNNLIGIHDNFSVNDSHVVPGIIRKIWEHRLHPEWHTMVIPLLGDGTPIREFTYAGDIAKIILYLMENYNDAEPINIGNTESISIKDLAETLRTLLDFNGTFEWSSLMVHGKENGQMQKPTSNAKLLSMAQIRHGVRVVGWKKEDYTSIRTALEIVCHHFKDMYPKVRGVDTRNNIK